MKRTIASLKTLLPRLAIAAFTLVCLVAFTYVLLALARGDGWTDALQRTAQETPRYFQRLATGDLGLTEAGSLTRAPVAVWPTVQEALPKSLVLLGASLFFAVLIGVPLGMITARWQNGPGALLGMLLSLIGISIPSFFAIILLQRFVLRWQDITGDLLVPVGGFGWDSHIILPALVLAARPIAQIARVSALSLQDIQGKDFISMARTKGLSEPLIFVRHTLRNALIPILTTVGISLRFSLSSLPVVEIFFGWNGAGALL